MLTMNKASKKYYKNLKIFLPIHGKIEKQFQAYETINETNVTHEVETIE